MDVFGSMSPIHVSFVAACTALVASIAGPLTTLTVSRRQFNASVRASNREKWIATLREATAELISLLVAVAVFKAAWKGSWNGGHAALAEKPELMAKFERIVLLRWSIRLLTNPDEPSHADLCRAIDNAINRLRAEGASLSLTESDIDGIRQTSHVILNDAWRRVKAGT